MGRHTNTGTIRQKPARRYKCRYLARLPLKLPYPDQVARVADLMARAPLRGVDGIPPAQLLVDATGVGLPVAQQFERAGLRPVKVLITGSEERARSRTARGMLARLACVESRRAVAFREGAAGGFGNGDGA